MVNCNCIKSSIILKDTFQFIGKPDLAYLPSQAFPSGLTVQYFFDPIRLGVPLILMSFAHAIYRFNI